MKWKLRWFGVALIAMCGGMALAQSQATKSPEEVLSEVQGLKKVDVAWRHIEWKTCLLDGLKASREQHKPIMLWVFIDRPINDERC